MNIMFGELILYQCKKTWIFEVNYGQLQRRKKGNHCASYTLCLGVGRKKKIMHIIEGLKVHQLNIQVPLRKQFMWTQTS